MAGIRTIDWLYRWNRPMAGIRTIDWLYRWNRPSLALLQRWTAQERRFFTAPTKNREPPPVAGRWTNWAGPPRTAPATPTPPQRASGGDRAPGRVPPCA